MKIRIAYVFEIKAKKFDGEWNHYIGAILLFGNGILIKMKYQHNQDLMGVRYAVFKLMIILKQFD